VDRIGWPEIFDNILDQMFFPKLEKSEEILQTRKTDPKSEKIDVIFLGPNLKSAVTYIQVLIYYSTFVQTNVSQLQSFRDYFFLVFCCEYCFFFWL